MAYLKYYIEKLRNIENYLDFAIDISDRTAGKKNVPMKLVRSHQLYIRLTVTCLSLIRLLPKNRFLKTKWDFWDFPSVAIIARNFIETYHVFYYIGVDNVSEEDTEFRLLLLTYHLNNEKYRLYKEFGASPDDLIDFDLNLPRDKEQIKNHKAFSKIEASKKKRILNGTEFMSITHKEISDSIQFNTSEFKPMYRFLSNQTHSTPLSFFSQSNERGRGAANKPEIDYVVMCIDFVTKYLLAAITDMIKIFPDCQDTLDKRKLEMVNKSWADYMMNH